MSKEQRVTRDLSERVLCHYKLSRRGLLARNNFLLVRGPPEKTLAKVGRR